MNELNPPAIHGEAIAGRAASVRKTLLLLSTSIGDKTFDMAELLYEAQENNYYSEWGYASLPEYAEKEMGLKARKAQYLARIVKVYRAVGLTRETCEKIHISKLREIATLDPKGSFFNRAVGKNEEMSEHIVRLILGSDELTLNQIKDEVAKLKGQVGPDRRVVRSFSTTQSAWENVIKPALELVRKKLGSEGRDDAGNAKEYTDGVCIEVLCADWLSDPNNEEPLELPEEFAENKPVLLPTENI